MSTKPVISNALSHEHVVRVQDQRRRGGPIPSGVSKRRRAERQKSSRDRAIRESRYS